MIAVFTGPSSLSRTQELFVVKTMEALEPSEMDTWRSGCAFGVDTIAAHQAVLAGILNVELYVPAAPHNDKLVEELSGRVKIIQCSRNRSVTNYNSADSYRVRNEMMTNGASKLVAFVKSSVFYRSGEWMTINIAKRLSVPVELNVI